MFCISSGVIGVSVNSFDDLIFCFSAFPESGPSLEIYIKGRWVFAVDLDRSRLAFFLDNDPLMASTPELVRGVSRLVEDLVLFIKQMLLRGFTFFDIPFILDKYIYDVIPSTECVDLDRHLDVSDI